MKITSHKRIIAGPCSAESFDQLKLVASALKRIGVNSMRVGIWKPRSRPGSFEGVGEVGLDWCNELQVEFGIQVYTEIMSPHHLEACLKKNIKSFWIGARTSTNPYMINEISSCLSDEVGHLIVKNPLAPDLKLWVGNLERFQSKIKKNKVSTCLRGFATYSTSGFRNEPLWDLAIELRNYFSDLEILVDPSHMSGERKYLKLLSKMALNFNFDGLMLEVHPDPSQALSDQKQQIKLSDFNNYLEELESEALTNIEIDLTKDRKELERIDNEIWNLLAKRQSKIIDIASKKKGAGKSLLDLDQFHHYLNGRISKGNDLLLEQEFSEKVYRLLHAYSLKIQSQENT